MVPLETKSISAILFLLFPLDTRSIASVSRFVSPQRSAISVPAAMNHRFASSGYRHRPSTRCRERLCCSKARTKQLSTSGPYFFIRQFAQRCSVLPWSLRAAVSRKMTPQEATETSPKAPTMGIRRTQARFVAPKRTETESFSQHSLSAYMVLYLVPLSS